MAFFFVSASYTNSSNFIDDPVNGLDANLLLAGWERSTNGQQVSGTSGATDRVYFSSGETGSERLYLRVTQTTADNIDFRAYSHWNTGTISGTHVVGTTAGDTRIVGSAAPLAGWIAVDKNGVAIVLRVAGVYHRGYFGIPARSITPQWSGQTTISNSGAGALSGQPVVHVANASNLTHGQIVWLVNQSSTVNEANFEQKTIQTIVGTTVTMTSNLTNAYDDGAIVAMDPQPMVLWGSGATNTFVAGNRYMLTNALTYPGPGSPLGAPFAVNTLLQNINPSFNTFNPDQFGQFPVEPFMLEDNGGGERWLRGYVTRWVRTMTGAVMASEDTMTVGSD